MTSPHRSRSPESMALDNSGSIPLSTFTVDIDNASGKDTRRPSRKHRGTDKPRIGRGTDRSRRHILGGASALIIYQNHLRQQHIHVSGDTPYSRHAQSKTLGVGSKRRGTLRWVQQRRKRSINHSGDANETRPGYKTAARWAFHDN